MGAQPDLSVGDHVLVLKNAASPRGLLGDKELGGEESGGTGGIASYAFVDYERQAPMVWLAILFVVVALLVGRMRGARSLVGLGVSLAIVLVFIVPAILDGRSPLAVAIVGSLAVMLVTMGLAHGVGPKSAAAAIGTSLALLVTALLGLLFTDLAHLTGFTSEQATFLQLTDTSLSLSGLVVAGLVIGALGVLDDLTLTQSSAVAVPLTTGLAALLATRIPPASLGDPGHSH